MAAVTVSQETLNGKMIADVEQKGAPSRWITYRALQVLKYFRELDLPGMR